MDGRTAHTNQRKRNEQLRRSPPWTGYPSSARTTSTCSVSISTWVAAITSTTPTGGSTLHRTSPRNLPKPISDAQPADPENSPIERLNWEHMFSPVMTNHLTFGYLNRNEGYYSLNLGSQLPGIAGVADTSYLPQFNFGENFNQLGNTPDRRRSLPVPRTPSTTCSRA